MKDVKCLCFLCAIAINVVFDTVPMLERKVSHHQQKLVYYEFFLVLHRIKFTDFYIEWNSPNDTYLYSEAASSRFVRGFKKKLGMQKGMKVHLSQYMK